MAYDPLQSLQASPSRTLLPFPTAHPTEQVILPAAPALFAGQQLAGQQLAGQQFAGQQFAGQQLAHHFRRERLQRQAFADYCQRHRALALQNQQELASMAQDWDVRGWLERRRAQRG